MNDGTDGSRGSRRRAGPRRAGVLAAALASIALLAAACGGSGSSATSGATAYKTAYQEALSYTRCMCSHGVPGFPDPTSQGTFIPTGIDPHSPQFRSADSTCHHLLPAGRGQRTAAQQQQVEINALKIAACVRARGITGLPEYRPVRLPQRHSPNHDSHPPNREDYDMNDDTGGDRGRPRRAELPRAGILTAAVAGTALLAACGSTSAAAGSTTYQQALAYAQCMRSHGEPGWPDPNSQRNVTIGPANHVGMGSPQYQLKSAQQACRSLSPGGAA